MTPMVTNLYKCPTLLSLQSLILLEHEWKEKLHYQYSGYSKLYEYFMTWIETWMLWGIVLLHWVSILRNTTYLCGHCYNIWSIQGTENIFSIQPDDIAYIRSLNTHGNNNICNSWNFLHYFQIPHYANNLGCTLLPKCSLLIMVLTWYKR